MKKSTIISKLRKNKIEYKLVKNSIETKELVYWFQSDGIVYDFEVNTLNGYCSITYNKRLPSINGYMLR